MPTPQNARADIGGCNFYFKFKIDLSKKEYSGTFQKSVMGLFAKVVNC